MRKLFYFTLLLFVCVKSYAQEADDTAWLKHDTVAYYMADDSVMAYSEADAKFLRLIIKGDTGLYRIEEYYLDAKPKLLATSYTRDLNYQSGMQGPCTEFFPTGIKKSESYYKKGNLTGYQRTYYPNGKLSNIIEHRNDSLFLIRYSDSIGNVLANNGEGRWRLRNDFYYEEYWDGQITNGLPNGIWKQYLTDTVFSAVYDHGKLISGQGPFIEGKKLSFIAAKEPPRFPGGEKAFGHFLGRYIRYPQAAREHNIQGRVILAFLIDEDGSLKEIKVIRSAGKELDAEAIRVLSMSPKWIPARTDNRPVKVRYSMPIGFALEIEEF
ncbi:TonB family protein [Mucilaginibacter litoreus]|uniref:TonB family protein n=1 Tax=Mucilaginibacter litoreus TaxID=1048221 RepID=A0ABW3ARS9_9SPHI